MTTTTVQIGALDINALLDAKDLARELNGEFSDGDVAAFQKEGINLTRAAVAYVSDEENQRVHFIREIHHKVQSGRQLSAPQIRAVLNIMRDKLLGLKRYDEKSDPGLARYICQSCGFGSETAAEHIRHKVELHDYEIRRGSIEQAIVAPEHVMALPQITPFDLSALPDGYYARPDSRNTSGGGMSFYVVRRLRKPTHMNKAFVYGKKITGSYIYPIGTLTVREFRGDTKRLHGVQMHGENFRGDPWHGQILAGAKDDPEVWAHLFAVLKQRCGICGRNLTTSRSKLVGIGPVCEDTYGLEFFQNARRRHLTGALLSSDVDPDSLDEAAVAQGLATP